ncbi:hypothetical protein OG735_01095 [Streptomyces sp. NBC_01210]|uniref:hypothetical protein n=1 Tax=Streptomyces sp. NBC_01210 TaxID=2903774 RepID=UPI002E134DA0|nr:hypothetical protein OG735_01095 [Streptomyces sp. NBC_01210]
MVAIRQGEHPPVELPAADAKLAETVRLDIEGVLPMSATGRERATGTAGQASFAELNRRHKLAVLTYARMHCREEHDAEELACEAMARSATRAPAAEEHPVWRIGVLRAVQDVAGEWLGLPGRDKLDPGFGDWVRHCRGFDPYRVKAANEETLALATFQSVSKKTQSVLWHVGVEGESTETAAVLLGTTSSAGMLASPAWLAFREACLREHRHRTLDLECPRYAGLLSATIRRPGVSRPVDYERHVLSCLHCTWVLRLLTDKERTLRTVLPVALIGWRAADYVTARRTALAAQHVRPPAWHSGSKRWRIRLAVFACGVMATTAVWLVAKDNLPHEQSASTTGDRESARSHSAALDESRTDRVPSPPPTISPNAPRTPLFPSGTRYAAAATPASRHDASASTTTSPQPQGSPCFSGFDAGHGALTSSLDETNIPQSVKGFTHAFGAGWSVDNSQMPQNGVREWRGWTLTTMAFWARAGADQGREDFSLSSGVLAVADPDEWDDLGSPSDTTTFDSTLVSPQCAVGAAKAMTIEFVTHYAQDGDQRGDLIISFDGGPDRVLKTFSVDVVNSHDSFVTAVPAGAKTARVKFRLRNAGNNWYWAVDNVRVGRV